MKKTILITGTFLGLSAIVLGAFAAHGLEKVIDDIKLTNSFETGVRYQMYHAFLLLIIGATSFLSDTVKKWLFYIVITGVILFSGSIYGLATNSLTAFNFKSIALITPIGGALLIIAWSVILISIFKQK